MANYLLLLFLLWAEPPPQVISGPSGLSGSSVSRRVSAGPSPSRPRSPRPLRPCPEEPRGGDCPGSSGGWKERPRLPGPGGTRPRRRGREGLVSGPGWRREPLVPSHCRPAASRAARQEYALPAPAGRPCAPPGDGSPGNCPRGRERAKPDSQRVHSSSVCESQRLEGTQRPTLWRRWPGLAAAHGSGHWPAWPRPVPSAQPGGAQGGAPLEAPAHA